MRSGRPGRVGLKWRCVTTPAGFSCGFVTMAKGIDAGTLDAHQVGHLVCRS
jgi:hypothetical protein